jgi:hypothetical protein
MKQRMDFIIQGRESKGADATGTCAYFDAEEEMLAIIKEWKRREVVSLYAATPGPKAVPEDLRHYFEEKSRHSGNLVLSKMLFNGPTDIFDNESMDRKYDIFIGNFEFTKGLLIRFRLYTEEGIDYIDTEFALGYVARRDEK